MALYHVNKTTGIAEECTSSLAHCSYGNSDAHYTSLDAAQITVNTAGTPNAAWSDGLIRLEALTEYDTVGALKLPAGRYFVGDPCYTAGKTNVTWGQFCDYIFKSDESKTVAGMNWNGYPVAAAFSSADGTLYNSNPTRSYFTIDSGLMGVVHEHVVDSLGITARDISDPGDGVWHDFEEDFIIYGARTYVHIGNEEEEDELFQGISTLTGFTLSAFA